MQKILTFSSFSPLWMWAGGFPQPQGCWCPQSLPLNLHEHTAASSQHFEFMTLNFPHLWIFSHRMLESKLRFPEGMTVGFYNCYFNILVMKMHILIFKHDSAEFRCHTCKLFKAYHQRLFAIMIWFFILLISTHKTYIWFYGHQLKDIPQIPA